MWSSKHNTIRILGLPEADMAISVKNLAANGMKITSIKQLIMAIKSKEDYKTHMINGIDHIKDRAGENYYVATLFQGYCKKSKNNYGTYPCIP